MSIEVSFGIPDKKFGPAEDEEVTWGEISAGAEGAGQLKENSDFIAGSEWSKDGGYQGEILTTGGQERDACVM